ncbi:hypothetical protein RI367_000162 [Sorochytrium milnesiophthora]
MSIAAEELVGVVVVHVAQLSSYFARVVKLGKRKRTDSAADLAADVDGEVLLQNADSSSVEASDVLPVDCCSTCGTLLHGNGKSCTFCSSTSIRTFRFKVSPATTVAPPQQDDSSLDEGPYVQARLSDDSKGQGNVQVCLDSRLQPLAILGGGSASANDLWRAMSAEQSLHCFCRIVVCAGTTVVQVHVDLRLAEGSQVAITGLPDLCYPPERFESHVAAARLKELYASILPRHNDVDIERLIEHVKHDRLLPMLRPYQRRAVLWCLRREGVTISESGSLQPFDNKLCDGYGQQKSDFCVERMQGFDINRGSSVISRCDGESTLLRDGVDIEGGILADEMGLGKTVEMLALVLMHPATPQFLSESPCIEAEEGVRPQRKLLPAPGTLIISPSAISSQWVEEIARHCPALRVFRFHGTSPATSVKGEARHDDLTPEQLAEYDVVVTTYDVLKRELHFARAEKERPRRHARKYERKTSAIVRLKWWRVVLDEAQMVDNPLRNAAEVAAQLPRQCVTGTPISHSVSSDLFGLCYFLGIGNYGQRIQDLEELMQSKQCFQNFLRLIMYRTTKDFVERRGELQLPAQTERVEFLQFDDAEAEFYRQLSESLHGAINTAVTTMSRPDQSNSASEADARACLRSALDKLRMACCHPSLLFQERRRINASSNTYFQMPYVLEQMYSEASSAYFQAVRELGEHKIEQGLVHDFLQQYDSACAVYTSYIPELKRAIQLVKGDMGYIQDIVRKQQRTSTDAVPSEADDDQDDGDEATEQRVGSWRLHLGLLMLLLHRYTFMLAAASHPLGLTEDEEKLYEEAEDIRRDILKYATTTVINSQRLLKRKFDQKTRDITQGLRLTSLTHRRATSVSSAFALGQYEELEAHLNMQGKLLRDCRDKLYQNIMQPLTTEKADGEEYDRGLAEQEHGFGLMELYIALISDRRRFVNKSSSEILMESVTHDDRGQAGDDTLNLKQIRQQSHGTPSLGSLLAPQRQLHMLRRTVQDTPEEPIVNALYTEVSNVIRDQVKVIVTMEQELRFLRQCYNDRVEYFRQLQRISDTVQLPEFVAPEDIIAEKAELEQAAARRLPQLLARKKYVHHLLQASLVPADKPSHDCLICTSAFTHGSMTPCGHIFCHSCITLWLKQSKHCPSCRQPVNAESLARIMLRKNDKPPPAATSAVDGLAAVSPADAERRAMGVEGNYSTKINDIVQHLVYLHHSSRDEKAIVFSQFDPILKAIAHALTRNNVSFIKYDNKPESLAKFKHNNDYRILILNAKSQSAGLTLVAATHVFKPLLNSAMDAQAINRVHRIGQTKPTFVHRYIVSDSIEERIYEIWRRRFHGGGNDDQHDMYKAEKQPKTEFITDDDLLACFEDTKGDEH